MRDIYALFGDMYRERSYSRAAAVVRRLTDELTLDHLGDPAFDVLGESVVKKIEEFLETGSVKEHAALLRTPHLDGWRALSAIMGAGPITVRQWIAAGITSVEDLRQAVADGSVALSSMQKLGLEHYDDLLTRIPRAEVEALGDIVRAAVDRAAHEIAAFDGVPVDLMVDIAGSYRRGRATSGDIDMLVANKPGPLESLARAVEGEMMKDDNYVDTVSIGDERYTFLYRSPTSARVRQIDVLVVKCEQYHAALLYFTGSWAFNESMRAYAKSQGFRLNQAGLFEVEDGGKLALVPVKSEQDIFSALGLEYVPPPSREEALETMD